MAVTTMPLRASSTSAMLSRRNHSVGRVNSKRAASTRSLAAVSTMKMNGTTKTTPATSNATMSSHQRADALHSSISRFEKNRIIG